MLFTDPIDTLVIDDLTDLALDDAPTDPDATSFYDIAQTEPPIYFGIQRASDARRCMIRDARRGIESLRDAIASGWDVGPELAHEEQLLAALEVA